nr:hypothetical protein [Dehalococcoidia bacterium]
MADEPREGRELPGATTPEDERNGGEPILIQIVDGQVELELTAAPAGQVRIAAMNRGEEACDPHLGRQDAPDSTVVHLREIRPGDSAESVVELRDGFEPSEALAD